MLSRRELSPTIFLRLEEELPFLEEPRVANEGLTVTENCP
jgi:hypothetical protein